MTRKSRATVASWMRPSEELTKCIIKTREANGMNPHQFARHFRRDYVTIWRWESQTRVPHRSALVEMLKMAPPECRPIFERYLEKTLDQILYEEYLAVSKAGHALDPNWSKEPRKHIRGIHTALSQHVNWIWSEAHAGNERAARHLVKLLEQAVAATEDIRKGSR